MYICLHATGTHGAVHFRTVHINIFIYFIISLAPLLRHAASSGASKTHFFKIWNANASICSACVFFIRVYNHLHIQTRTVHLYMARISFLLYMYTHMLSFSSWLWMDDCECVTHSSRAFFTCVNNSLLVIHISKTRSCTHVEMRATALNFSYRGPHIVRYKICIKRPSFVVRRLRSSYTIWQIYVPYILSVVYYVCY